MKYEKNKTSEYVDSMESQETLLQWREHEERNHSTPDVFRRRLIDITTSIIATTLCILALQYIYRSVTFDREVLFQEAISSLYSEEARQNPAYHCGNSSSEARQLGCIFDISVVGWVPEPCYDGELNRRFLDWGWKYFEDKEGTKEVSIERLAESAGTREPFWVQHGYHITHCELAWQRMHRALMGGKRLTTHLLNPDHTHHCGMMTEMRDDFYKINAAIMPLLNTC